MNIKYVSLFSLIFVSSITLNNKITAMEKTIEEIEKSIKSELLNRKQKISNLKKELQLAEEQKNKDEIEWNTCHSLQNEENKDLYFWQTNTIDCSAQKRAYEGSGFIGSVQLFKEQKHIICISGSKPKSNYLQLFLDENNTNYNKLKTEFKKCKELNNIDCWNDLTKQLNEKMKTTVVLRDVSSKNEIIV